MMKFSANLGFLFPEIASVLEKYRAAHKAGFTAVECGDVYKHTPLELIAVQKETQLQQALLNTWSDDTKGFAAVPGKEEEFHKSLEISIEYCKALQCKRLHVLAGQVPVRGDTGKWNELCTTTYINNLKNASQRLSNDGVTLVIEPISTIENYFLCRTDQAVDILGRVDCLNVKLQLDLYHHQMTHGRIVDTLRDLSHLIEHIQIAQVPGRHEPDEQGEINYKFVLEEISKLGYGGWIGCEYVPLYDGFNWMQNI